ncbi:aminotransferase class III-fold pyridoxal phosphate-dependent enzyme [Pseudonocardia sp. NPDC049635]|uniref:aminotransferase family protein n=1 Tax=Pseudonocardia sp. NPDC049635 TaxID=3155506 RepID=UPI0034089C35
MTLWHPFADMHTVRNERLVIQHAKDVWIWGSNGHRYFDATSALWYSNVGHGRVEIVEAIATQLAKLDAFHLFADFANEPALELADALAARAPVESPRIFFTSGGGDAIDTAAKLCRSHFQLVGQTERTILLHREHGYHGTHGFGTALAGMPGNRVAPPFVPDVAQVAWDDASSLERRITELGSHRVAAFFCEPVIGAGGVLSPPPGYLREAADVCARHGVLFVADAVICGFGRLGNWFGIERFDVQPDLITFAKGVTSGYQPLGGVVVSGAVASPFWDSPGNVFRHGQTYSGHPAACAAGLATIRVIEREGLQARASVLEGSLFDRLTRLNDHALVAGSRGGVGVLGAVDLDPDRVASDPWLPAAVAAATRRAGVIVRPMSTSIAVSPPLTATEDHLDIMEAGLRAGLDEVLSGGRASVHVATRSG